MNNNLTVGKPETVLRKFCIPLFASIIFQQLYNIADSLVAGKFVGENALAAVGNSYEITLIFIAVAFGCNIGCSVIVAQFFGGKKYSKLKTTVYTTWICCSLLCILMMVAGLFSGGFLLQLINTPNELMADSKLYLDIYIYGLPFLFFYNIATGIFSALGDSKTPFYFLAVSSTANIFVDIWFVSSFHMGVAGVAWATFLCQGISCVAAMAVVQMHLSKLQTEGKTQIFSVPILKKIVTIAVPSILQQGFISVGNIIIQRVINDYGPGVIAGYAAAVKLNNMVITSFTTLGNGISSFTAQNIGAGLYSRIKQGHRAGIKLVWTICIPIVLLYMVGTKYLIMFFLDNPSKDAMETGVNFLHILVPFYFVVSVKLVTDGVLRGAGMMKQFMIATFTDLILRVVLAIVFAAQFGSVGIWCAWPVGWTIAMVMSAMFYRKEKWLTEKA